MVVFPLGVACDWILLFRGLATGADVLALVTEWQEFRSPDFDQLKSLLKHPVIFDGRNIYNPELLGRMGFSYYGIGRTYAG